MHNSAHTDSNAAIFPSEWKRELLRNLIIEVHCACGVFCAWCLLKMRTSWTVSEGYWMPSEWSETAVTSVKKKTTPHWPTWPSCWRCEFKYRLWENTNMRSELWLHVCLCKVCQQCDLVVVSLFINQARLYFIICLDKQDTITQRHL